jgi:predicted DNA-binding transcriptional regulator AlpA
MNNNYNLTKPAYSVNEVLAMLPFGRTKLYQAINSGKLKATKYGKSTWFMSSDIAEFLNSLNGGATNA